MFIFFKFDWEKFVVGLFGGSSLSPEITNQEIILVTEIDFFEKFLPILTESQSTDEKKKYF